MFAPGVLVNSVEKALASRVFWQSLPHAPQPLVAPCYLLKLDTLNGSRRSAER